VAFSTNLTPEQRLDEISQLGQSLTRSEEKITTSQQKEENTVNPKLNINPNPNLQPGLPFPPPFPPITQDQQNYSLPPNSFPLNFSIHNLPQRQPHHFNQQQQHHHHQLQQHQFSSGSHIAPQLLRSDSPDTLSRARYSDSLRGIHPRGGNNYSSSGAMSGGNNSSNNNSESVQLRVQIPEGRTDSLISNFNSSGNSSSDNRQVGPGGDSPMLSEGLQSIELKSHERNHENDLYNNQYLNYYHGQSQGQGLPSQGPDAMKKKYKNNNQNIRGPRYQSQNIYPGRNGGREGSREGGREINQGQSNHNYNTDIINCIGIASDTLISSSSAVPTPSTEGTIRLEATLTDTPVFQGSPQKRIRKELNNKVERGTDKDLERTQIKNMVDS
jgi:hypothetical protein